MDKKLEQELKASLAAMKAAVRRLKRTSGRFAAHLNAMDAQLDRQQRQQAREESERRFRDWQERRLDKGALRAQLITKPATAQEGQAGGALIQSLVLAGLFFKTIFTKPTKPEAKR